MNAYIIKGFRSAVGKAKRGGFKNFRSDDLAVEIISHLLTEVPEIDPKTVDDVIVGCANPEGEQGLQVGRLIAARALGVEVPGITINRYCASGLEAISMAAGKIAAGFGHIYVAGGTESMSLIPMTGYKLSPSYRATIENVNYHVSMGHTAEAVASKYEVTREQADEFSFNSHRKAATAIDSGLFEKEIGRAIREICLVARHVRIIARYRYIFFGSFKRDSVVKLYRGKQGIYLMIPVVAP